MTSLSVVIPVFDENESIPELFEEISEACSSFGPNWEAIFVDDGSTDGSWGLISDLARNAPEARGVRLRRNFGKSAALAAGIAAAHGDVIVTMDGDGQDDPGEIPALVAALDDDLDLVSGWKRDRKDSRSRRLASHLYNWVTARLTGLRIHDLNCGLKSYRRDCAKSLPLYGDFHRLIPVLAQQQGWRVGEMPVNHRPRPHGHSRYGSERIMRGLMDLVTVVFLGRYQQRPLHLFGGLGLVLAASGIVVCVYLTIDKLSGASIGNRPLLFLGILLIVVGVQLFTLGLLGQMLVTMRVDRAGPDAQIVAEVVGKPSE